MLRVLSVPAFYALELTPACNNRCAGCPNRLDASARGSLKAPLDGQAWIGILDKILAHASRIKLTGGEPTLHPDFFAILDHLDALRLEYSLFTNARWAAPQQILQRLQDSPALVGLLISLHGATAATHEAFTGVPGSFKETCANIRRATAAGLAVNLSTVIHSHNLSELPAVVDLAQTLGATKVVFNRYLTAEPNELTTTETELREAVGTIDRLLEQGAPVKFGNCIPQCFIANSSVGCLASIALCAIDPWGRMKACTHVDFFGGSLLEASVQDAWLSPPMQAFRAGLIATACRTCARLATCHGGCHAVAVAHDTAVDPLARPGDAPPAPSPVSLHVHPAWRPHARLNIREEPWGLALLQGNRLMAAEHAARPLLAQLNGQATLAEIEAEFGAAGLSLVAALYDRGFIHFM